MDKTKKYNLENSDDDELEKPLLVEESYTFDDKEGLKSTDLNKVNYSAPNYSQ
jgi:hypothetical protein